MVQFCGPILGLIGLRRHVSQGTSLLAPGSLPLRVAVLTKSMIVSLLTWTGCLRGQGAYVDRVLTWFCPLRICRQGSLAFIYSAPVGASLGKGPVIQPGSTGHFQLWHRDTVSGAPSSSTTSSVAVIF